MKYNIIFKTKQSYNAAKTVLTHHYACRFNDLDDYRIEFYQSNKRDIAKKMLVDQDAVIESEMEYLNS